MHTLHCSLKDVRMCQLLFCIIVFSWNIYKCHLLLFFKAVIKHKETLVFKEPYVEILLSNRV